MKTEYLYGIIGLLGGIVLAIVFANNAVNTNNQAVMGMMGMRAQAPSCQMGEVKDEGMGMGSSMEDMMDSLDGKSGDDFDKVFIEEMIVHHQGAIDMANQAKKYAGHDEIKAMADDIISAQTKEINQMRKWQIDWNY